MPATRHASSPSKPSPTAKSTSSAAWDTAGKSTRAEKGTNMFCNSCNNSSVWLIILIIILFGWGGFGCGCGCDTGNNGCGCGCGCN